MSERTYLDCCTVLNLQATGRFAEVLDASRRTPEHAFAVGSVARRESLFIRGVDGVGREEIDLGTYVDGGILVADQPDTPEEFAMTVALAAGGLDDGEAETAALAIHRAARLASDDEAALRILRQKHPAIEIVRTSQFMKVWAVRAEVSPAQLRETLIAIRVRARFIPPRADPLCRWWADAAA